MKTCPHCNAQIDDAAVFCGFCGSRIGLKEPPAAPQVNQPAPDPETQAIEEKYRKAKEEADRMAQQANEEAAAAQRRIEQARIEAEEQARQAQQQADQRAQAAAQGQAYQQGQSYQQGAAPGAAQGAAQGQPYQQGYPQGYQAPVYAPIAAKKIDHTDEYDPSDISKNKIFAMLVYLLDFMGIIIALLAGPSEYVRFHVRQALKFTVVEILTAICIAVLVWTIIVPVAGAIFLVVLLVIKIICFVQVCKGKACEPAIIRSIGFLE